MPDGDTLTVKEAAARLRVSDKTIYLLVKSGVLPCRRLGPRGGKVLLDSEDVEKYWAGSKGAAKAPSAAQEEARMASRHLRPPSPSRPRA